MNSLRVINFGIQSGKCFEIWSQELKIPIKYLSDRLINSSCAKTVATNWTRSVVG